MISAIKYNMKYDTLLPINLVLQCKHGSGIMMDDGLFVAASWYEIKQDFQRCISLHKQLQVEVQQSSWSGIPMPV